MLTVLLPTDFSDNAINAANYAVQLFAREDCKFILLHSWYMPHTSRPITIKLSDALKKENEDKIQEEVSRLRTNFKGINVEVHLEQGELTEIIDDLYKSKKFDLIIMGTKGASGVKEKLFGSNTTAIIQMVNCPVISVPVGFRFEPPRSIAFASDFKRLEDKKVLWSLSLIAKRFNCKVKILNVLTKGEISTIEEAKEALNLTNLLPDIAHTYHFIADPDVSEAIDLFVKQEQVDMIAMINRTSNFFDYLFNRSETKKIALKIDVPLLSMHDENISKKTSSM